MNQTETHSSSDIKRFSIILAILAVLLGMTGLAGWMFDSFFLRSFMSDGATMKANTALIIIASGLSLLLVILGKRLAAVFFILLTGLLCSLILTEHIGDMDLGIDEWWFKDKDTGLFQNAPGRTSAATSVNVLFLMVAMLMALYKRFSASQYIACLLFLLVYASLLGHVFRVTGFYRQGHYSGIAFHTSLSLLFLDFGLLLYQSRNGWLAVFYGQFRGKNLLAYVISYFLCGAPMLVAFYLFFINHGQFSAASGVVILIVASALISIPVAYMVQKKINMLDLSFSKVNRQLEIAMEASNLGMWDLDLATGMVQRSQKHAEIFGQPFTAVTTGDQLLSQFHPNDLGKAMVAFERAQANGKLDIKVRIILPNNQVRWVQIFGKTSFSTEGKAVRILGTMMDITNEKEIEVKKEAFIGVVSHELKTPLTSFKSYVQLVLRKARAENDQFIINMLSRAELQADKMTGMIHSFLDVTRLESGKLQLNVERFEVNALLLEVAEEARLLAKSHTIIVEEGEFFEVTADRNKIGEVITNFLSNAVKYSSIGTSIVVRYEKKEEDLIVTVTDQGFGISSHDQEKLFDLFYRVEQKEEHNMISGFGIGLYLSAEIIRLHNGKIGVHSEEGIGSSFYFSIPL